MRKSSIPEPVKRRVQATAATVGRFTAGVRMLPSFLIVGAKRAGTTSMYETITGHPQILGAVLHKEVHYFDTHYDRGQAWYRGHFPTRLSARLVERRTGLPPITGEATPYYMWHPLSPERIHRDLPGVRLVVMVRDPVARAHSEHAHSVTGGWEDEPFERALELEGGRLRGEAERMVADPTYHSLHHAHHAYVARGRYVEQLETLERVFGRDRLHVIDSDALFADSGPALQSLFAFLGVPPWQPPKLHNLNARPRPALPADLHARLSAGFAPYDERLAQWLGWVPSWRR